MVPETRANLDMPQPRITRYPDGIASIDAEYITPGHAAAHVMVEDGRAAFIDTGTNFSIPYLLATLDELGVSREAVDYVLLTHVHLDHAGGAGLLIDYGHVASAAGETLQAVRRHERDDLFAAPGEADLSAHVDSEALAKAFDTMGARVHGPITQAQFLRRLGIEKRAATLKAASGSTRQRMFRSVSASPFRSALWPLEISIESATPLPLQSLPPNTGCENATAQITTPAA